MLNQCSFRIEIKLHATLLKNINQQYYSKPNLKLKKDIRSKMKQFFKLHIDSKD